jgi:hypothetical protein
MITGIVILSLAIIFVAAALFVIALLILWPLIVPGRYEEDDGIERFEIEPEKSGWGLWLG